MSYLLWEIEGEKMITIPPEHFKPTRISSKLKILNVVDDVPIDELIKRYKISKRTIGRLKSIKKHLSKKSIKDLHNGHFSISFADKYIHQKKKNKKFQVIENKNRDSVTGKLATEEYLIAYQNFFKQIMENRNNNFKNTDKELISMHLNNLQGYIESEIMQFNHVKQRGISENGRTQKKQNS